MAAMNTAQSRQAPTRNGTAASPELDQRCGSQTTNVPLSVKLSVIFLNTELNAAQPGSCGVLPWEVLVSLSVEVEEEPLPQSGDVADDPVAMSLLDSPDTLLRPLEVAAPPSMDPPMAAPSLPASPMLRAEQRLKPPANSVRDICWSLSASRNAKALDHPRSPLHGHFSQTAPNRCQGTVLVSIKASGCARAVQALSALPYFSPTQQLQDCTPFKALVLL